MISLSLSHTGIECNFVCENEFEYSHFIPEMTSVVCLFFCDNDNGWGSFANSLTVYYC